MTKVQLTKPGVVIGILLVLLGVVFVFTRVRSAPAFYSCTQAKAAGYHDIPKSSPLYRKSLDRDGDEVACEL